MSTTIKTCALILFLALFVTSCTSVNNLVESGHYEEAVAVAQRRLTGKQKKNPKYVRALEEAFNRANSRDMEQARRMIDGGNTDWARVHGIYAKVDRRQRALEPLLPLTDKNGYRADLRFARVEKLLANASESAAAQLYDQALTLLDDGRNGDKQAARSAYARFDEVDRFRRNFRNAEELQREAFELGKVYIAVDVINESGGYLPAGFERELLRVRTANMDSRWRYYDFDRRRGKAYDYDAQIVIRDIAVSPERLTERRYTDEREITDGTEYVLDANGNVLRDSLGNDVTRPRRVLVRADVVEVLQTKSAVVTGSLLLYDNRERRVVDSEDLTAEAFFENYASTFNGDRRALSSDSRRRIGNRPVDFPSDEALILDAAEVLKPQLQERLARSYRTI